MTAAQGIRAWHIYWLCWASIAFVTFLVPEIYALATNWRRTLSAAVWSLERFTPGQPIPHWSAGHIWFISIYAVLVFWLLFHFGMGWWRAA